MSLQRFLRLGAVVALGLAGLVVAASPAQAAPLFQMPFPCGQTWTGETRSDHKPQLAVDFNRSNDDGDPVVASLAGTAYRKWDADGYGNYIDIDHGNGWVTRYAHLSGFAVANGSPVGMGQVVGYVGTTGGSTGPHLHYEQRTSSGAVSISFNGGGVYYYGERAYTSRNCGFSVRDVNRDGRSDLVAISSNDANLYRYSGNGDGTFDPGVSIGVGWGNFRLITLADITGDGVSDILGVHTDGSLYRYTGTGSGTFASGVVIGSGWGSFRAITSSDFNGDGHADLLGIHTDGGLYRYAGTSAGTLTSWGGRIGAGWSNFRLITSGDVNGDGRADLLAVHTDGDLYRWSGAGDGTFASGVSIGSGWGSMRLINSADYNNDGRADVMAVHTDSGLYRYAGTSSGTLTSWGGRIGSGWSVHRLINS